MYLPEHVASMNHIRAESQEKMEIPPIFCFKNPHNGFWCKNCEPPPPSIPLQENLTGCLWTSLQCNHKMAYKNKLLDGSQEWITKLKRRLKSCYWFSYFTEQNGNQRCIEQQEKKQTVENALRLAKCCSSNKEQQTTKALVWQTMSISKEATCLYTNLTAGETQLTRWTA